VVTKGTLTGSGSNWTLAVTTTAEGNIKLEIPSFVATRVGNNVGPNQIAAVRNTQTIPVYKGDAPVVTLGTVERTGNTTATIKLSAITVSIYNGVFYYYRVVAVGAGDPNFEAYGGSPTAEGVEYTINVSELTPGVAADVWIYVIDYDHNITKLKVDIPATGNRSISGKTQYTPNMFPMSIGGITVELYSGGIKIAETTSSTSDGLGLGDYAFSELYNGAYTVKVPAGTYGGDYYFEESSAVTIAGANLTGVNLLITKGNPPGTYAISGVVRVGGTTSGGVGVKLYNSSDTEIASGASNALGAYTIYGIANGTYTLKVSAGMASNGKAYLDWEQADVTISGTGKVVDINLTAVKTVSVGAQSGTLAAGTAGNATFTVTTSNISNNTYTATLNSAPTVATVGDVTISGNSGTLTVSTTNDTPQGTYSLTLTIDGTTSSSFDLVVGAPDNTAPTLSSGTVNRTGDTDATIGFTTTEAGTA
jgi:hypothetical protein